MAKASEQFRQSDVTTWGIVALVLGGIAVMGANVSALMPQSLLSGLHKTRIEGASVEQLRNQVTELREEAQRLNLENDVLTARFTLGEQQSSEMTRRVGALEVSLPELLERVATASGVDRSSVTAAITPADAGASYEAEGGSVTVRQQPMAATLPPVAQPLPQPLEQAAVSASTGSYAVALGPSVAVEQAAQAWRDLDMKLGPLLFGMTPMLVDESAGNAKRIVAGPISQLAEATTLCGRLERISVSCMPVPFTGTPLDY